MPRDSSSADELLDTIYELVERLIEDGPEETRHDRANLGNEIVLCASVLRQRLMRAEQAENTVTAASSTRETPPVRRQQP